MCSRSDPFGIGTPPIDDGTSKTAACPGLLGAVPFCGGLCALGFACDWAAVGATGLPNRKRAAAARAGTGTNNGLLFVPSMVKAVNWGMDEGMLMRSRESKCGICVGGVQEKKMRLKN